MSLVRKKRNLYLTYLLCIFLTSCIGAGNNSPVKNNGDNIWPEMSGVNLNGKTVELPGYFRAQYNIIAVGFEREHQPIIDEWYKWLQPKLNNQMIFYEIPVIYQMNFFNRLWLNNVMRYFIKDEIKRLQTVTVYTDRKSLAKMMQFDIEQICILVVDRSGKILWQEKGGINENKKNKFLKFLQNSS